MAKDLKKELRDEAEIMVSGVPGIRVHCGETSCIFEFITYKYKGQVKEENLPQVVREDPPKNEASAHPPPSSMMRSNSVPVPHFSVPFPWPYFGSQQDYATFIASMSQGIPHQDPTHTFRRSNTMGGPYPEHHQHQQPGEELLHHQQYGNDGPNNDTAAFLQKSQFDASRGAESQGRGRGRSAIPHQGTAIPGAFSGAFSGVQVPRSGGVGRGRGGNGQGDVDRMRRRSSSSGFMSSVSEEDHVTSD